MNIREMTKEHAADLMNKLQVVRFALESIVGQPEKTQLNQSRASIAMKRLREVEDAIRQASGLANQERINAHLGAEYSGHLGGKGTGE